VVNFEWITCLALELITLTTITKVDLVVPSINIVILELVILYALKCSTETPQAQDNTIIRMVTIISLLTLNNFVQRMRRKAIQAQDVIK
jgi:hypothetical protein